jgi:hypothetical protein
MEHFRTGATFSVSPGAFVMTKNDIREVNDPGYTVVLDQMDIPRQRLSAYSKPVDLSTWPRDGSVWGGSVERLSGKDLGHPLASLPGAKKIPFGGSKKIDVRNHPGGLFIVGIDYVPRELNNLMVLRGFILNKDGTLVDRNGESAVAFVTSEMYHVRRHVPKQQGGVKPKAAPFPFTCFSFDTWAVFHKTGIGGNHYWYDTSTTPTAYGPDGSGGCSNASPHTRIDYLQALAAVNLPGTTQQGWSTDQISAYDVVDGARSRRRIAVR